MSRPDPAGARPPGAMRAPDAGDGGFSLIEVIVSLGVIGTVMGALTSFYIGASALSKQQGDTQTAVQVAVEAAERVRAMRGSELLRGRDRASTQRLWDQPPPGVAHLRDSMRMEYDSTAPALAVGGVSTAELPTTPEGVPRNGIDYQRYYYVGACWQSSTGQICEKTMVAGYLPLYRVVLAVTWPGRQCADGLCSYVTATLVSSSPNEPVFNPNATASPPAPLNPGAQIGQQDVAVNLQLAATDGVPPLTWITSSGLPDGLSMNATGVITGVPTTVRGYTWTATVRDADGRTATTPANTWTIRARPVVTGPGNQTTISGTAVSVSATMTGGSAPVSWQASGLPPGLSISAAGVIGGTPARPGPDPVVYPVTVTVTDAFEKSAQRSFSWTVLPALQIDNPGPQTTKPGRDDPHQIVATGGTRPYLNWTATGLPPGLSIDTTGLISGKPQGGVGSYTVRVSVTDSAGTTVTTGPIAWEVGN